MRKEIWTYMPDPTSDSVTDYRRGRGLADDIGTPYTPYPVIIGLWLNIFMRKSTKEKISFPYA